MDIKKTDELIVGDQVIVYLRHGNKRVDKIERLTKTQIVLEKSKTKYRRSNGHSVGEYSYYSTRIGHATEDQIIKVSQAVEHSKLAMIFETKKWLDLPLDKLREVYSVVSRSA